LVALFTIFPKQGREILNGWGFEWQKTIALEDTFDFTNDIAPFGNRFR
jgi:hypothetical protein